MEAIQGAVSEWNVNYFGLAFGRFSANYSGWKITGGRLRLPRYRLSANAFQVHIGPFDRASFDHYSEAGYVCQ